MIDKEMEIKRFMGYRKKVIGIVFSQNLKLQSIYKLKGKFDGNAQILFVTTHKLYSNEKIFIEAGFPNSIFLKFADFLNDADNDKCDTDAAKKVPNNLEDYYKEIKKLKNALVLENIKKQYDITEGYICSDDLGIDFSVWVEQGFKAVKLDYYYVSLEDTNKFKNKIELRLKLKKYLKKQKWIINLRNKIACKKINLTDDIFISHKDGKKYVFLGKMEKIEYRMDMKWERSKKEYKRLKQGKFETAESVQYLSTLHESGKCIIPDDKRYDVRYIQDGYMPPNYSSQYLKYKPENVEYYAWDMIGKEAFKAFDIPVSIMPFRKKLYLPEIQFSKELKTILVATSGSGDWTAQKNRSDDDLMIEAFIEIARRFPDIEIIYRCHPAWVHPAHTGINSIRRVAEYIEFTNLTNIHLSGNIPQENLSDFVLSFPRSLLEEDLKKADIVFGEHSVAMLDAGFEGIPFASVNLTGRRNFFCGISDLGFPHCESIDAIEKLLKIYSSDVLKEQYFKAIRAYNSMTDEED